MDLIGLIVLVIVLGLVWWVITTYVPMPPTGRTVLAVAFAIVIVLALLSFLGLGGILHWKPQV